MDMVGWLSETSNCAVKFPRRLWVWAIKCEVSFTGLASKPDLKYILRLYDDLPFGDVQVEVINTGHEEITVQTIRVLDVIGEPALI